MARIKTGDKSLSPVFYIKAYRFYSESNREPPKDKKVWQEKIISCCRKIIPAAR